MRPSQTYFSCERIWKGNNDDDDDDDIRVYILVKKTRKTQSDYLNLTIKRFGEDKCDYVNENDNFLNEGMRMKVRIYERILFCLISFPFRDGYEKGGES